MNGELGRVFTASERQRGLIAVWQMERLGLSADQIRQITKQLRRVYRGVYTQDDLDEMGWLHAAVLAMGPGAALSHASALLLLGLHDNPPAEIHVSVPRGGGRGQREGIVPHRRTTIERWRAHGIPVTSPAQSLKDARLPPHELYHALDRAANLGYPLTLPLDAVVRLQRTTRGTTKSPAEAAFVLLCAQRQIPRPLVNHHLNGFETDFHWPEHRLVVEVDGYEFHKEREQFEEDRRRGMIHAAAGYTVIRVSASQVMHTPDLVVAAVRQASANHAQGSKTRRKRPK